MAKIGISVTISEENLDYLNKVAPNNKSEFLDSLLSEKMEKSQHFINDLEKLDALEKENEKNHISIISRVENIILPEISRQKALAEEKLKVMKVNQEKRQKEREDKSAELEKLIKEKKLWDNFLACSSDSNYKDFMEKLMRLCYEKSELAGIYIFNIPGLKELKSRLQETQK